MRDSVTGSQQSFDFSTPKHKTISDNPEATSAYADRIAYPPVALTAGDPAHVSVMLVLIGMGIMMMLTGLSRTTSDELTIGTPLGGTQTRRGSRFRIPDWAKGSNAPEIRQKRATEDEAEYRQTVRKAVGRDRIRATRARSRR